MSLSSPPLPATGPVQPRKKLPVSRAINPWRDKRAFQQRPLQFLQRLQERHGDIVRFRLFAKPLYFINHPDYIKHVLHDNAGNYEKSTWHFKYLRILPEKGLFTQADGQEWVQQRRLIQSVFHREFLSSLDPLVTESTQAMLKQWERSVVPAWVVDIADEMSRLTLTILGQAFLGQDIGEQDNEIGQAFLHATTRLAKVDRRSLSRPQRSGQLQKDIQSINTELIKIIAQRRKADTESSTGDLLSLLVKVTDPETGATLTDQQICDEIMTFLVEGYETCVPTLLWMWDLLRQNEAIEQRLYTELDTVLKGRTATLKILPQLPVTRMVVEETMRHYPAHWLSMRQAKQQDTIGGYTIPRNATVVWSPYVLHRHPDFWQNPTDFEPSHFAPELVAARPRHAYLPFGDGPRQCMGGSFALTTLTLVLATIAQRFRLILEPGHKIVPDPLFTVRLRHGMSMFIQRRKLPKFK